MTTENSGWAARARVHRYRPRRPLHALLLAVVLGTAAALAWLPVLWHTDSGCPSADPGTSGSSAQRLPANGLDAVLPAPPQITRVQVLNASGMNGRATVVDATLAELGFAPTTTPANDPRHPDFDLHCYGEIRFGAAGQAAARTLSLAVPCAELVRDVRPDTVVDLALGSKFLAITPNGAARQALLDLAGLGQPVASGRGGLAAQAQPPAGVPEKAPEQAVPQPLSVVNPELLSQARQVRC